MIHHPTATSLLFAPPEPLQYRRSRPDMVGKVDLSLLATLLASICLVVAQLLDSSLNWLVYCSICLARFLALLAALYLLQNKLNSTPQINLVTGTSLPTDSRPTTTSPHRFLYHFAFSSSAGEPLPFVSHSFCSSSFRLHRVPYRAKSTVPADLYRSRLPRFAPFITNTYTDRYTQTHLN